MAFSGPIQWANGSLEPIQDVTFRGLALPGDFYFAVGSSGRFSITLSIRPKSLAISAVRK